MRPNYVPVFGPKMVPSGNPWDQNGPLGWELGGKVKVFNSPHPEKTKTLSTAGIMLIVNDSFLKKFEYQYWTVVEPGYVGILNLGGKDGMMQVVAVYSHCTPGERRRLWEKVRGYIDKRAMVVMAGDYNFVERD